MSEFWLWMLMKFLDGVSFGIGFVAVVGMFGVLIWLKDRKR